MMNPWRKERIDNVSINSADMQRRCADEQDFVGIDDAGDPFFPMLMEVEELASVGHVFAEGFRQCGEKSINVGLVGQNAVEKREKSDGAPVELF